MPSPQIERKLAAIMFTDIAGYTESMSKSESKTLNLLEKKRSILKPLLKEYKGTFVKEIGDGTLSYFESAVNAATCAVKLQETTYDDKEMNIRVGIHIGDIVFKDGDVFGGGVNVASRLESIAPAGGVCVSKSVYDELSNQDDFDGIELGQSSNGKAFVEFQKHLLSLWQQGIILAINSKNNFEDAIKVIREHPDMVLKEEHFASLQINWNDKAQNLKAISEELNIGLGSIVYFDDDPVNQERIKQEIPEVLTVKLPEDPSQYTDILMSLNDFNVLQKTDEDLKRGKMYSQQRQRAELEQSTKSIDDFLKQLDIKVKIKKADKFTIPRISQLTLKTNQFNLTTKRYQEEDIIKFSSDNNMIVGCAQIEDKFGDSGITNAFIIEKNDKEWKIDTFLLSCRIIGRGIEDAIISHILNEAKNQGVEKIRADFIPTKKNSPAEAFLPNCGFKKENGYWIYDLNDSIKTPDHLLLEVE